LLVLMIIGAALVAAAAAAPPSSSSFARARLDRALRASSYCRDVNRDHVVCGGVKAPEPQQLREYRKFVAQRLRENVGTGPDARRRLRLLEAAAKGEQGGDYYTMQHSLSKYAERRIARFTDVPNTVVNGAAAATAADDNPIAKNFWLIDYLAWKMALMKKEYVAFGLPAYYGQFPHAVSLQLIGYGNVHFCGGSIYDERHILTAAHCVQVFAKYPDLLGNIRAVAGIVDNNPIYSPPSFAQIRGIEAVAVYPQYSEVTLQYDVALLRVDQPFDLAGSQGKFVSAVVIANRDTPQFPGITVNVNGFGKVADDVVQTKLHQVNVTIVPISKCQSYYQQASDKFHICTYNDAIKGASACQGDSGGGLVYYDSQSAVTSEPVPTHARINSAFRWILMGVVSGGKAVACGNANNPNFFTRISEYQPWIVQQTSVYWSSQQ
jgi:trypsin